MSKYLLRNLRLYLTMIYFIDREDFNYIRGGELMRNKIAFFDIDGTLVEHKENVLIMPESTKLAIKKFREKGNLAFICSGRQIRFINDKFGTDMFDGYISGNGTEIFFKGEKVYGRNLSQDMLTSLIKSFDELGVSCNFAGGHKGYSYKMDRRRIDRYNSQFPGEAYILEEWKLEDVEASSLDIFYKDDSVLEKCREYFKDMLIFNAHGADMSADVSLKDWGKAEAIEYITKHLEIPMENTYAFGDGHNDVEMIKKVNTGIAMGNAVEELKEVADYITSNIFDDGIYNAMKAFELI